MKTLQTPISEDHKSAMFFDGIIARDENGFSLETYQDGEIQFMGNVHVGLEIIELAKKGLIDDEDIENEETIDILVDKFFTIKHNDKLIDEDLMYDDYDEALEEFEEFGL